MFALKLKLKLKLLKNKCCHEKRTGHWNIVTSLLLEPLKQCLIEVISFRHSKSHYSLSVLMERTTTRNFGSVFSKSFGSWNLRDKITDTS